VPLPLILGGTAVAALLIVGLVLVLTADRAPARAAVSNWPAAQEEIAAPQVDYRDGELARWARQLRAADLRARIAAANTMAGMGPRAREAVPDLLASMARTNNGVELDTALGRAMKAIGPAAVPDLVAALSWRDPRMRFAATSALTKLGPQAEQAVQPLIGVLERDGDYAVRASAAAALGAMGSAASSALPALRRALGDPNATLTHNPQLSELRVRAQLAIDQIEGRK
jgi:HEAT repeat protein